MPKEIDYANLDLQKLSEMCYRELFVRFERANQSTSVNVLLDGWHLAYFFSAATTLEEFITDCKEYLASDKYEEAYNNFSRESVI